MMMMMMMIRRRRRRRRREAFLLVHLSRAVCKTYIIWRSCFITK
jgi:hypothetical protein